MCALRFGQEKSSLFQRARSKNYKTRVKESVLERVLFGELNLRKAAQTYKLAVITIRQHVFKAQVDSGGLMVSPKKVQDFVRTCQRPPLT